MADGLRRTTAIALVTGCLLILLVGQAVGDAVAPTGRAQDTGRLLGRTGFAYLTGVRTFAAAALWNRIDPIKDTYYQGLPLGKMQFMLPTMRLVNWLDPQFEQAYFVAPWVVYDAGHRLVAVDIGAEGVRNNPQSAWLRTSYAQVLFRNYVERHGRVWLSRAVAAVDAATQTDMRWPSDADRHDGYQIIRVIYKRAGMKAKEAAALAEIERLDKVLGDALPPEAHNHNGNGVPSP